MSRRSWTLVAVSAVVVVLLVGWALLPWSWSTLDDAGLVAYARKIQAQSGPLLFPLSLLWQGLVDDLHWGLFRPSYWLYHGVYVLPVGVVHALRLAMFGVALAGPVVYLKRSGARRSTLVLAAIPIMLISGTSLSKGIFFPSLQELSGAAFVGLGLMARRRWLRIGAWTVATWFKAPFAWILIGECVVLWRSGHRRAAVASGVLGLGSLTAAVLFSLGGSYTGRYLRPSLWGNIDAAFHNAQNYLGLLSGALLLAVVWWVIASESRLRLQGTGIALAIALAGYATQILLWETSGYYFGPVLYLAGATLVASLAVPGVMGRFRQLMAGSVPWILALLLLGGAIQQGWETNSVIRSIEGCMRNDPGRTWVLYGNYLNVFTDEGAVRLAQNVQLSDPAWSGTASLLPLGSTADGVQADRVILGPGADAMFEGNVECRGTLITVVALPGPQ